MMSSRILGKFHLWPYKKLLKDNAEVKSCSKVHKIPHMADSSETFIPFTGERLAKSLWACVFFHDSNFVPGKGNSP